MLYMKVYNLMIPLFYYFMFCLTNFVNNRLVSNRRLNMYLMNSILYCLNIKLHSAITHFQGIYKIV